MTPTTSSALNSAGRNALITALMVCCGFIVCVTPGHTVAFVGYASHSVDYRSWYYQLTLVLVLLNSCINCFIYAAKYREFQQAVRRLMSRIRPRRRSQISVIV